MAEFDFTVDDRVDITDVQCPVTFVKTKVALEELDEGQVLQVHMNGGEPAQNVPRSVKEEGHEILKLQENEDGTFASLQIQGVEYKGRELFDMLEKMVRTAYFSTDNDELKEYGKDLFWYLWCGPVSPPFDKKSMATFERYFIADASTHVEEKGNYYRLKNRRDICEMILQEFGITDMEHAHIINGHIPVKAASGESPIKADGRLLVIDGGFSKVYHEQTGIAGYTLIYNSHGMRLVRHHPFESIQQSISQGMDVIASTQVVEYTDNQILVRDTDKGKRIMARVEDLKALLQAYRTGLIRN